MDETTTDIISPKNPPKTTSVPDQLLLAGDRGGAGRNVGHERAKALGRKRRKVDQGEDVLSDDAESDIAEGNTDSEEADEPTTPPAKSARRPAHTLRSTSKRKLDMDVGYDFSDPGLDEEDVKNLRLMRQELEIDNTASNALGCSANVTTVSRFYMSLSNLDFCASLLVLDEAHQLKGPRHGTSRAAMLFPATDMLMITATPVLNTIEVYFGLGLQGVAARLLLRLHVVSSRYLGLHCRLFRDGRRGPARRRERESLWREVPYGWRDSLEGSMRASESVIGTPATE